MRSAKSIQESLRDWSNPGAKPEVQRQISQK
jgi:hypothetical protein